MSMKVNKFMVSALVIILVLSGAVVYLARDRYATRWKLADAIAAMQEARSETSEKIREVEQLQREYVRVLQEKSAAAKKGVVTIREQVEKSIDLIPDDDLGHALDLELERRRKRRMGEGSAGLGG